jgi:hypothetical protein
MSTVSRTTKLGLEVLAGAALLGVAGDALLRTLPWGLNAFLCTTALVAVGWSLARRNHVTAGPDAPWLAAAAIVIGSNFAARASTLLHLLDLVGLAIVLAVACLSLQGVALRGRHAWQYARAAAEGLLSAGIGVFQLAGVDISWSELSRGGRLEHARAAALGGAIAFPLLVVFGGLFASADTVFRDGVARLVNVDFGSVMSHTFTVGVLAALAAGYFRGALVRRALPAPLLGTTRLSLGVVPVVTALLLVDLLFLAFVVIQVRYLFGGAQVAGLTYAEYARRGFFELVTVSALVLPVLLASDWLLRNEPHAHQRVFRIVAGVLLGLLGIVIASALRRMSLYVTAYGLSEVRLYSTAFMLYLALVFAWFAWTALRGARRRFAFGALVQGFATLGVLHVVNPDAVIVRTNLARPAAERPFDGWYAASLSADAVPLLLEAIPRLDPPSKCSVVAGLLRQREDLERDGWRNWNLARARARRLLRDQGERLQAATCSSTARRPSG